MLGTYESPIGRPPQELRRKTSDVSIGHRSVRSSDSSSSVPPSPTPKSPSPSPRTVKITTAFEHVHSLSTSLQTTLSKAPSELTLVTINRVKEFQDAVTDLFEELRHLPGNVPPTPALILAIQGCSFEVLCFGSSAETFRTGFGCEEREERQEELAMMLNEATASLCVLLELVARAIEDAEAERKRLEESAELDTARAERGSGSGNGTSVHDRPLSWLVPMNANNCGFPPLERKLDPSFAEHLRKVSQTNHQKAFASRNEPSPPSTPDQPVFSRKEPLIPTKRPSKGKYDVRLLRKSVHLHRLESDVAPLRDSLAIIGNSAPFPTDVLDPDPDDLNAPYVENDPDGGVRKANLRGLVGVITSGSATEHEEFVSMVLTTFRLFASGEKLADALYCRYTEQCPGWLTRKGKVQFEWTMAQKRMRSRVATVLHLWLELHWKPEDVGAIPTLERLVRTIEEDRAFHANSLRMSLDRIIKDKDCYHGKRFREEERYKPTTISPSPTLFEARKDLASLASRDRYNLTIAHFATPEGVIEFARMITMVESKYYRKLSPENFVHYKSDQTKRIRKELGDFEQRYKAWIVWTIVNPEDPVERAHVIEFWFEVAKICVEYRNFNTAYQITCVLGDPEFENMAITRQVLEQLDKNAIYEFWKVCLLYENEAWWGEINSSSLPAIPVSHILIRWRIYIEECGLRGLYKQTCDFSLPEFQSKGRIDVGSFLNLADLVWDIERTYEPHVFVQVPWIESWFLGHVFASHITDFGLETRHLKTGVAKDNPIPTVPDTILAKLVTTFEAKLRREKEVKLIPLVPRKPSVEVIKKAPANKLKKRPSALTLRSHSPQSQAASSRPGTPTSQNSDSQTQRQPNKLRKRSRSFGRASPDLVQQSYPIQSPPSSPMAQALAVLTKDGDRGKVSGCEVVLNKQTARIKLGPPPSPSHGKRFEGVGGPRRSPGKVFQRRPSQVGPPPPSPPRRTRPPPQDWEVI